MSDQPQNLSPFEIVVINRLKSIDNQLASQNADHKEIKKEINSIGGEINMLKRKSSFFGALSGGITTFLYLTFMFFYDKATGGK